jgi:ATP:corrinoid adenosyltransferase
LNTDNKHLTATPAVPRTNAAPPGWGQDELSKFLQETHQQQYATFHNKPDATAKLIAIDELFVRISKDWLNPKSEILAMLLLRCHAAMRAATGEAMAGQVVESFRQSRIMMENAAYAIRIHRNPHLAKVWLDRHVDEAGMKASKSAFQRVQVVQLVKAANIHAGDRFEMLYQRAIDFGGHPNERSVTGSMKMTKQKDRREMLAVMIHGDDAALNSGLKSAAQCAMVSLEMLQVIFDARFEILGVNAAMLELRRGL